MTTLAEFNAAWDEASDAEDMGRIVDLQRAWDEAADAFDHPDPNSLSEIQYSEAIAALVVMPDRADRSERRR